MNQKEEEELLLFLTPLFKEFVEPTLKEKVNLG